MVEFQGHNGCMWFVARVGWCMYRSPLSLVRKNICVRVEKAGC